MNRSVTVSTKALLTVLVVVLAVAVAYLLGNDGGSAHAASTSTTDQSPPGTIVMTGTGSTTGIPDELAFTVSVGVLRGDLQTALADSNATMRRVLGALTHVGVRRSDVQTTGLHMNAVYTYHSDGSRTLQGYRVGESAQVLVRDLARGGQAVSAAVAAGGNDVRVGSLALRVGNTGTLLAHSRSAAVRDATDKAKEYAAATGQSLGRVVSVREVHTSAPPPQPLQFQRAAGLDAAVPIRAGRDKLGVTVRIVWELS
jgi:uncharacterized protein YggE